MKFFRYLTQFTYFEITGIFLDTSKAISIMEERLIVDNQMHGINRMLQKLGKKILNNNIEEFLRILS